MVLRYGSCHPGKWRWQEPGDQPRRFSSSQTAKYIISHAWPPPSSAPFSEQLESPRGDFPRTGARSGIARLRKWSSLGIYSPARLPHMGILRGRGKVSYPLASSIYRDSEWLIL